MNTDDFANHISPAKRAANTQTSQVTKCNGSAFAGSVMGMWNVSPDPYNTFARDGSLAMSGL